MDNNNSTTSSPNNHKMYGILAPVGVVLFITTIMLLSYFFAHRRRITNRSVRLSGAAVHSDHDTDDDEAAELGLDEATIIRFPMLLYSQATKNRSNSPLSPSSSTSCSICLSNYEETDTVRILPECKHFFHVKCVDPWLKLNSTCPICRKPLLRYLSDAAQSITSG